MGIVSAGHCEHRCDCPSRTDVTLGQGSIGNSCYSQPGRGG